MNDERPASATELAAALGDELDDPATIPPAAYTLVARARDLVAAVVATDVDAAERQRVADELLQLSAALYVASRDPVILLGRHSDGRLENLTQAGSGRLNPQSVPLEFDNLPPPPPDGTPPASFEVKAQCILGPAHSGPPEKAHGGVLATILDEVLGVAATAAGASGLTGTLTVRYEAATPLGVPLVATGRYTHSDGRRHWATGEIRHEGVVTARAEAIYISRAS